MNKIYQALKERGFHKFIIGAALQDFNLIEEFAYLACHAGFEVIDISAFPLSILAAKRGLDKAKEENPSLIKPLIMISINIGFDPHFRRVSINDNCTHCLACLNSCPSEAFSLGIDQKLLYEINRCYGCSNCFDYCNFDAFEFEYWSSFQIESLLELKELGADAIEIHLNNDLREFGSLYSKISEIFALESFCIGSEKMNAEDLQNATQFILDIAKKPCIIQVDGLAISGALDRYKNQDKDLISMENLSLIQDLAKLDDQVYFQLAGGINEKSLGLALSKNLNVHGVALGSYARNLILKASDKISEAKNLVQKSKDFAKIMQMT